MHLTFVLFTLEQTCIQVLGYYSDWNYLLSHCFFFYCTLLSLTSIPSDGLYPQQNAELIRSEHVDPWKKQLSSQWGWWSRVNSLRSAGWIKSVVTTLEYKWSPLTLVPVFDSCRFTHALSRFCPSCSSVGIVRFTCKKHYSPQGARISHSSSILPTKKMIYIYIYINRGYIFLTGVFKLFSKPRDSREWRESVEKSGDNV